MIRFTDSARALLAVVSVFVIGIVAGCVLDRSILAPPADAVAASVRHGDPRHHDEVLAELRAQLGLSAEQARRVEEIFATHQGEIDQAWKEIHASLQHTMRQATTEIEAVLDAAQIERLHAWLAERHGPSREHGPGRQH